jgi:membrane-bound ClpP family serine protease
MKSTVLLAAMWIGIALVGLKAAFGWPGWVAWVGIAMIVVGVVVPQKKSLPGADSESGEK